MKPADRSISDVVCAGCSCLCDDISVEIKGGKLAAVENACELGRLWFEPAKFATEAACLIEGKPASLDDALTRVAQVLKQSKSPLISGLNAVSIKGQQLAVGIADSVGAAIDVTFRPRHNGAVVAMQQVGKSTATFGEIRDRADLVVIWRANPAVETPRLIERLNLHSRGALFVNATAPRNVVVIDSEASETAGHFASNRLALKPGADLDALRLLRAMAAGVEFDAAAAARRTGVTEEQWRALFEQMKSANYVAILYGHAISGGDVAHPTYEALYEFARDLHQHTRCVCLPAYNNRNAIGARQVLAWQTGYPMAVDMKQGHPQYAPGESDAAVILERRETDAVVALLERPHFAEPVAERPPIVWFTDEPFAAAAEEVEVAIRVPRPGLTAAETFYRNDGVPLTTGGLWESTEVSLIDILGDLSNRLSVQPAEL